MAKLYRTSGTGNAQQTLDVNDEKIKIYADEASLDADLANINENEIVATNEEDSQRAGTQYPVDIVQDGNMNAVTSNAVADSLSYSTTEQKTGGTWIDGKPIYRKCGVYISESSSEVLLDSYLTSTLVDTVVAEGGSARYNNDSEVLAISGYNGTTPRLCLSVRASGLYKLSTTPFSVSNLQWWIEYTKTTD